MSTVAEFDALPARLTLSAYRGAAFPFRFTYLAGDPPAAVDITGWASKIRLADGTEYSTANGKLTLPAGVTGAIYVALTAADTAARPRGSVYYVWTVTPPGGDPIALVDGLFAFNG